MPFQSVHQAEQRLETPEPLTEQEWHDLMQWMHLLSGGSRLRLEAHLGIGNMRAIQALNETSAKIEPAIKTLNETSSKVEGAVRRMDESSTMLGTEGLRVNKALFVWTIVGIAVSAVLGIVAVWIAIKSYKDASISAIQQEQTLDASRQSLESAVQSLNRLTEVTEQQAKQLEEYQKQALARPDFSLDFWFADATPRTLIKTKMQPILEYEVRYDNFLIFAPIIRNTSKTSAHNVRILIGLSDTFESIDFAPRIFSEVPSSMAGFRVFQREVPVFHPGQWQVQVIAKIKADTRDGVPQMSVSVDGSDLTRSYQQWIVFRKRTVPKAEK